MNETRIRAMILLALIVTSPWPLFLFAVGELLPVPIIMLWAFSGFASSSVH
jgi:hypothetical protein